MEKEEFRNYDFEFITKFDVDKLVKKVLTLPTKDFDGKKIDAYLWCPTYRIAAVDVGDLSFLIKLAVTLKKPLNPKVITKDKELWKLVEPMVRYLENMNPGKKHGAIVISNLQAGRTIPEHRDYSQAHQDPDFLNYSNATRRYHVVLTTNDHSFFTNGNTTVNMKVGECWDTNKGNLHSVRNDGQTDRMHLIIDLIPKGM